MLRWFLYPLLLLILLPVSAYVTLPFWLPYYLTAQSGSDWQIEQIKPGYPTFSQWQLGNIVISAKATDTQWRLQAQELVLSYQLLDLWQQGNYQLTLDNLNLDTGERLVDTWAWAPLLQPSGWLEQLPEKVTIKRLSGRIPQRLESTLLDRLTPQVDLSTDPDIAATEDTLDEDSTNTDEATNAYVSRWIDLQGRLEATPEQLNLIASLSTRSGYKVYMEAMLNHQDKLEVNVYNQDRDLVIGKLTSQVIERDQDLLWQGQGRMDLAYLTPWLDYASQNQLQSLRLNGQLGNRWRITLPLSDINDTDTSWSEIITSSLQGENNIDISLSGSSEQMQSYSLDASITHTFTPNEPSTWLLNPNSQLRLTPVWNTLNLPGFLSQWQQTNPQITLLAESTSQIITTPENGWQVTGDLSAQVESASQPVYLYGKLHSLGYLGAGHLSASGQLQGFVPVTDLEAWLGQTTPANLAWQLLELPNSTKQREDTLVPSEQLQVNAELDINWSPKRWQIHVYPNSQVSLATPTYKLDAAGFNLFASDQLFLTALQDIHLLYYPQDSYWQWGDVNIAISPLPQLDLISGQSTPYLLTLLLQADHGRFVNTQVAGSYQLNTSTLSWHNWPDFGLQGQGQFVVSQDAFKLNFAGLVPEVTQAVTADVSWDEVSDIMTAKLQGKAINVYYLQPVDTEWPLYITEGSIDYQGQGQWRVGQQDYDLLSFEQEYVLDAVNGYNQLFTVNAMQGRLVNQLNGQDYVCQADLYVESLSTQVDFITINDVNLRVDAKHGQDKATINGLPTAANWQLQKLQGNLADGQIHYQPPQDQQGSTYHFVLKDATVNTLPSSVAAGLTAKNPLVDTDVFNGKLTFDQTLKLINTTAATQF